MKYLGIAKLELTQLGEFKLDFFFFWVEAMFRMAVVLLFWHTLLEHTEAGALFYADAGRFLLMLLATRVLNLPLGNGDQIAAMVETPVLTGTMATLLCRPLNPLGANLSRVLVDRLRQTLLALLLLVAGIYVLRDSLPQNFELAKVSWLIFVASIFQAVLIHFFFYTLLGLFSFWIGHVWSLLYIVGTIHIFMSGVFYPLDIDPTIDAISRWLPFRYCGYSSAGILLGWCGIREFLAQSVMLLATMTACLAVWKVGVRRFESNGG